MPLVHARALASHHDFVRALARGLVGPEGFEDVAQETLLAGLTRRPERDGALRGWLASTARHLASKFHRGTIRRRRREVAAARPEALPSACELVERIELEQAVVRAVLALREPQRSAVLLRFYEGHPTAAIAERLSVPADTVRARLRRGLAELRMQLDQKFGRREEWVAALLPVAGFPPGVVVPVLATAGVAAGTTGAVVMGAKAITILTAACATALVAWWALPDRFVAKLFEPAVATSSAQDGRGDARHGDRPLAAPASVDRDKLAATREVDSRDRLEAAALAAAAAAKILPPPGSVQFEVVDARTRRPLNQVKVHFLHEQRFADYDGGAGVDVKLTSGTWEANVASPGYEPALLSGIDVKVGETAHLGLVALERGNAVVEGRVVAHHLAGDKPVVVELFGDGRSPCDLCLSKRLHAPGSGQDEAQEVEVGGDCGFHDDRDLLQVTGDRSFRFANLAAGIYWLRACDPEQRIVEAVRLEVGRGGTLWRELDVSAPTRARFELRHEGGGLFSGAWSAIHLANPAEIHFSIRRGGQEVGSVDVKPSYDDTLASVGPPIAIPGREPLVPQQEAGQLLRLSWFVTAINRDGSRSGASSFWAMLNGAGDPERLDRERQEGDALAFDFGAPGCDGVALKARAIRPDLHEVAPLPRAELTVVVSCGDYRSDELPLDLRGDPFQPFVVAMKLRSEIAERLPEIRKGPPTSCIACHGAEAPTDGKVVYGGAEGTVDFSESGGVVELNGNYINLDGGNVEIRIGDVLQRSLDMSRSAEVDVQPGADGR